MIIKCLLLFCFIGCINAACHAHWVQHNSSCYYFGPATLDWYRSASSCREHRSKLVEIETEDENRFLKHKLNIQNYAEYWLGGRDDEVEGEWEWSSGEPFRYKGWIPGEPDGPQRPNEEDCACMSPSGWFDAECDSNRHYICEKESFDDSNTIIG